MHDNCPTQFACQSKNYKLNKELQLGKEDEEDFLILLAKCIRLDVKNLTCCRSSLVESLFHEKRKYISKYTDCITSFGARMACVVMKHNSGLSSMFHSVKEACDLERTSIVSVDKASKIEKINQAK